MRTDTHLKLSLLYTGLNVISTDPCISIVWLVHACYHRNQCGFTRSIRPKESKSLFFCNGQVKASDSWVESENSLFLVKFSHIVYDQGIFVFDLVLFLLWSKSDNFLSLFFWEIVFFMLTNVISQLWVLRSVDLNLSFSFEKFNKWMKREQWTSSHSELLRNDLK